jgi:rubrerythrin
MASQLIYISVLENNLERYEAKVKEAGTVSESLKMYIERKKKEIRQMKDKLLAKS